MSMDWLSHLDPSASASISAIATAISAIATGVIALLTVFLWLENRRLRKAGAAPQIVAYLAPHPDGHGGINFILANVGKGPAFAISFEFIGNEADFRAHRVMLENDKERAPITVLPQDERIVALFGISFVLYGTVNDKHIEPLQPFNVKISFKDEIGRKVESTSLIDIRQFAGLRGVISKPPISDAADTLKNIESHLGKIARQSANFTAFVNVSKFEDEYMRKAKGEFE